MSDVEKIDKRKIKKPRKKHSGMFQKGQSGNPGGRPKSGESLSSILRKKMDQVITVDGQEITAKEMIAIRLLELAINKKDLNALKYCFDRIDGTPKLLQEISGNADNPLNIAIQVIKPNEQIEE